MPSPSRKNLQLFSHLPPALASPLRLRERFLKSNSELLKLGIKFQLAKYFCILAMF